MKDAIVEIIKWIRESVRPVVVVLFLSAVVLFSPHSWVLATGLDDAVSKYRWIAFLCFVGSCIWLVSFPIEAHYQHWKGKQYLNHLTEEERHVLRHFIQNAKKTQAFAGNKPVARHLVQKHLLIEMGPNERGHTVFVIKDWVFERLTEHPELAGQK